METDWKALTNQLLRSQPHIGLAALAGRKMIEPLMEGAQLTKDVYKGDVDLQDPATTARAMAAGPTALSGTMPLAARAGADLGVFGGLAGAGNLARAGHTRPYNNMVRAEMLEKEIGTPDNVIHEQTGWHRGTSDRQRKFEIDDSPSKVKIDPEVWAKSHELEETGKLSDYLDHPELYKAYPHLADFPVTIKKGKYDGYASNKQEHGQDMLFAQGQDEDAIRSILLHEIQHNIQSTEGFGRGMNFPNGPRAVKETAQGYINDLRNEETRLSRELMAEKDPANRASLEQALKWVSHNMEEILKVRDMRDYDLYRNAPGEKESSNVQLRRDWDEMSRRLMYPPDTANDARGIYR